MKWREHASEAKSAFTAGADKPAAVQMSLEEKGELNGLLDNLRALAAAGAAVLVLSSDLDEVEELAGTVAVLFRGRLLRPASATPDRAEIGRLMAGSGVAT